MIRFDIQMKESLRWWMWRENLHNYFSVIPPHWITVTLDASAHGWEVMCGGLSARGQWTLRANHVVSNILEISAARLALQTAIQIRELGSNATIRQETVNKNRTVFDQIFEANKETIITKRVIVENLDIAVPLHQSRMDNGCSKGICLWPKSPDGYVYIPYMISSNYTLFDTFPILTAMKNIEDVSCIRFPKRTTEKDYISFEAQTGCWSSIGHAEGGQTISLEKVKCMTTGIANHEILHALGLHHEHVREDRDQFIQVQWDNIISGYTTNFEKAKTLNEDLTQYDYYSVMHYPRNGFAIDSTKPTLTAIPEDDVVFGLQLSMSTLDMQKINTLYNCGLLGNGYDQNFIEPTTSTTTTTTTTPTTMSTTITTPAPTTMPTTAMSTTKISTPSTPANCAYHHAKNNYNNHGKDIYNNHTKNNYNNHHAKNDYNNNHHANDYNNNHAKNNYNNYAKYIYNNHTKNYNNHHAKNDYNNHHAKNAYNNHHAKNDYNDQSPSCCGGLLTAPTGVITSPNYPMNYPSNAYCHWNITTNTKFKITFTSLDIENTTGGCRFDKLKIYNGRDLAILYKSPDICGQTLPSPIKSYVNTMQIIFTSDSRIERAGFRLVYEPSELKESRFLTV
ncbi:embryonic protein UVS.2-like [Gastrophryne carolinensis]